MPKQKFNFKLRQADNGEAGANGSQINDAPLNMVNIVEQLEESRVSIPFKILFVPREKIVFNPRNDIAQENVQNLADNILHNKLAHNLEGYYDEETDKYILTSGERRTRAIDLLIKTYKDAFDKSSENYLLYCQNVQGFERGYPFNVSKRRKIGEQLTRLDEIDEELRLIDVNVEVRNDQEERFRLITKKKRLLEEKNCLLSAKEKININKTIAKEMGISERQVQKYNAVSSLVLELQEEFKKKNISLTEGSTYALLSKEEQLKLVELLKSGEKMSAEEIKTLRKQEEEQQKILLEKEKEILNLQKEKETAINTAEEKMLSLRKKMEEDKKLLEKQIEQALDSDSPDKERLISLEEELQAVNKENEKKIRSEMVKNQKMEEELKKLNDEIDQLKKKPLEVDTNVVKAEIQLDAYLSTIEKGMAGIRDSIKKLEGTDSKKLQDYKKKLEDIFSKYNFCGQ